MGYNQHQSFYLRDRWLAKGLSALQRDSKFFFQKDAFEKIGLGKNMVQSLRHWVQATGTADDTGAGKKREIKPNLIGEWVLDHDPSLQDYGTTAILHTNLTFHNEPSSTWHWFFNIFSETTTTREDIFDELKVWIQDRETRVVSPNSIKRDIDCLIRMYTAEVDPDDPEEITSSPFSKLGLLKEEKGIIYKTEPTISDDSYLAIMYLLLMYCREHGTYEISLNSIINDSGLLGRTFNLNRSSIVTILTDMIQKHNYPITFTRTNNLDVVKVNEKAPHGEYLINFYR